MTRFPSIATATSLVALLGGAVLLLAASPESKPSDIIRHDIPTAPERALLYTFDTTSQFPDSTTETKALVGIWRDGDRLIIKGLNVAYFRRPSGGTKVETDTPLLDKVVQFDFDPKGMKEFSPILGKNDSKDLKDFASILSKDFLPLLFVAIPDNFEAKPGFMWGEDPPADDLSSFKMPPPSSGWEVRKTILATENTTIVVCDSTMSDAWQEKGQESLPPSEKREEYLWASKTVLYDAKAKRIRCASSTWRNYEYSGGQNTPGGFNFLDVRVTEVTRHALAATIKANSEIKEKGSR